MARFVFFLLMLLSSPRALAASSATEQAVALLCDKRIALLGELPSHGEARAFAGKAAIVRALVDRCGYSALLFEAPIYEFVALEQIEVRLARIVYGPWQDLDLVTGHGSALGEHSGERVFYVAPWLSRLSGVTMTVARLARRVWAARKGLIEMPTLTAEQEELVALLLDPVILAPNAP